jgi:hypothetical protein
VASARVSTAREPHVIRRALNAMLPGDIRVLEVEGASPGFHARYHAAGKVYEYRIWQGDLQPPFARTWSWHVPRRLDVAAMDRAARLLEGRHDFSAFQSSGGSVASAVRTVTCARAGVRAARPDVAGGPETMPVPAAGPPIRADRGRTVPAAHGARRGRHLVEWAAGGATRRRCPRCWPPRPRGFRRDSAGPRLVLVRDVYRAADHALMVFARTQPRACGL